MLIRINKINNVRSLRNFSSDKDFLRQNIVYALNGSGKTNLSRFLGKFQDPNISINSFNDLLSLEASEVGGNVEFDLSFDNSFHLTERNTTLPEGQKILVYNKDFLENNITINDFSDKAHDGKINIGKISKNQNVLDELLKEKNITTHEGKRIRREIDDATYNKSRELRKRFHAKTTTFSSIINFDNLQNEKFIERLRGNEQFVQAQVNYDKVVQINEESKINSRFSILPKINYDEMEALFWQSFIFETIEKTIEDHISDISKNWIHTGLEFHKKENREICPFCRQSTNETNITEKYLQYINSLKRKTLDKIDGFIQQLSLSMEIIADSNKSVSKSITIEINELHKLLGISNSKYTVNFDIEKVKPHYDYLKDKLQEKKEELEDTFFDRRIAIERAISSIKEEFSSLNAIFENNNSEINIVNRKLSDVKTRKSQLRKSIASHELVKYYDSVKQKLETRTELLKKLDDIDKKIKIEKAKAPDKEKKELIITFLNSLLISAGLAKYEVGNDFVLMLKTKNKSFDISKQTKLVSDGEKSIVAFSYFIASTLQYIDTFEDLDTLTLIIDDPIASNSYNYLHGVGNILKQLPLFFRRILENTNDSIRPQLIILTHNLQFYNLLSTNVFKKKKESNFYNFNFDSKTGKQVLKKVNSDRKLSEYLTALKRIYEFTNNSRDENIGGDIRKVIETICSFHFLEFKPENITKIFDKEIGVELKLVADDYTHTDFNNFEDPLPQEALRAASLELLSFIEAKYPEQFLEVEKICKN